MAYKGVFKENISRTQEALEWVDSHVTSVMCLGFGARAALYHFYKLKTEGSDKRRLMNGSNIE